MKLITLVAMLSAGVALAGCGASAESNATLTAAATAEPTPAPTPEPTAEATPAPTPEPTAEATPEPTPEGRSVNERIARKVKRAFKANFGWGGDKSMQPVWYGLVTGFAEDLDPFDGSIEVYTSLFPDSEGEMIAREIGMGVIGVGWRFGLCKADVMAQDGTRLYENERRC